MTEDARLRALYQDALARRTAARDTVGEEVQPAQLEALAAGRLAADAALPLIDRVMSDPVLLQEFELLRAVHAAGADAAPGALPRAKPRVSARWVSLAAAAVLVVAVPLTWRMWNADGRTDVDSAVRSASGGVALSTPARDATVEAPVRLSWLAVSGAVRYRVEVVTEDGALVVAETTTDTMVTLGAERLRGAGVYQWSVEAVAPSGDRRSENSRFTLRGP